MHEVVDNRVDDDLRKTWGTGRTCFRDRNHVSDFLRNRGGKGGTCSGGDSPIGDLLRGPCGVRTCVRGTTQKGDFFNFGQALVPDTLGEQFNRCSGKQQVAVVKQSPGWQTVEVPDGEGEGVSVGIVLFF